MAHAADIAAITADLRTRTQAVPNFSAIVEVDGETPAALNPDVDLCACSTTKVAAAMAVMSLVQHGLVDLMSLARCAASASACSRASRG
jgi:beta-lactamase class A